MDRDEALKLLKGGPEGIKEWNRRRQNGEDIPSLSEVDLRGAYLIEADLSDADLSYTDLSDADLSFAFLTATRFQATSLINTKFNNAFLGDTVFSSDLSDAIGLNEIKPIHRSIIDINSILSFKDELPEKFLRGCGLRDEEIAYFRGQIGKPIRFYTCFISYSTSDEEFASRLHNDFQNAGIRCWKWNEDARTGKSMWGEIDHAIRKFNKLVLIASESSLKSPYVGDEIERALQKERNLMVRKHKGEYDGETDVLFPVRIDDYIFDGWEHERKPDVTKKVIADACGWDKDNDKYRKMRDKLIADLKKQSDI